jgi:dephospho-CoA kinase
MKIFGITGGVATGKSTVTGMLAEEGAQTVSADDIARALLAPDTALTRSVLAAFPLCYDATRQGIDRRALGHLIFADAQARAELEALTHPAIIAALELQIAEWRNAGPGVAVAEIPLLFEAGLEWMVDSVVVVACDEKTQITRLQTRQVIDEAEARRQIAAQWPLADKIARANYLITTDGDRDDTRRQVQALWETL